MCLLVESLDEFVYFDKVFKSSTVVDFLEELRGELKKSNRKNSRGSFSGSISFSNIQDQFVRRLRASLECVFETDLNCLPLLSPSIDGSEQSKAANSTKAPLLGRSNKQDKKKGRDNIVNIMKGIELKEQLKSTDAEWSTASSAAATYRRGRSGGSQSIEKQW